MADQVSTIENQVAGENHVKDTKRAEMRFRCADVGYKDCAWQLEGKSADEMLPTIQQHAWNVHHLELKEGAIQHVRNAIHDAA